MTKKHNPLENPPAASSSDDGEVDSSAGEEEHEDDADGSSSEEEEEDQPKPPVKAPSSSAVAIPSPAKTAAAQQASDADSGSETETDSDSDTEQPPPNQRSGKAILTKKGKSPPPKSGTKRPSEETSSKDTKRAKKDEDEKKTTGGEDSKKPAAFQRLWTEDDEISVLQGMIDFKNDTGNSPYDDTNVFYDYIKKSISFDVSKNQFMDKLRSLKKKYMGKEKPSFTKPHDQKSYKLCKFIWGPDGMGLETANGVSKKKNKTLSLASSSNGDDDKRVAGESDWFEGSFLARGIAGCGIDEDFVRQSWRLLPVEDKKTVEHKVKILRAKEVEFVLLKTELLHEVASMIALPSKN